MADVLVLGADGFIGSHLVDELAARGERVRAFDRFRGDSATLLAEHPLVERFPGDFLDPTSLQRALVGVRRVVHLISTTTPATSGASMEFDAQSNVVGSVRLLEACIEAGVERIAFASTGGAIYGRGLDRPLRETDVAQPKSPYAIGKLAIEGYLRFLTNEHGIESVSLRISNPYGERQSPVGAQGAIPIFLRAMLRGDEISVRGDGSMVRDYVYVRDVAAMVADVVLGSSRHDVYNVGSGQSYSVLEVIGALEEATGTTARVQHVPLQATDVDRVELDVSRFREEFGTPVHTPLSEGLPPTVAYVHEWLDAHRETHA